MEVILSKGLSYVLNFNFQTNVQIYCNDTVYSVHRESEETKKYTLRIVQPHKHNYGQNTQDAFVVLLDEEGKCNFMNTLYFFDIKNPDNTSCSYLGNTLDDCVYLY
jgi:hypothetical protein